VSASAPADDPELAVTVLVEHGGGGGAAAGPITMEIISRYFDIFGGQSPTAPEGPGSAPASGAAKALPGSTPAGLLGGGR
jgi:penicillin-binding protein 2